MASLPGKDPSSLVILPRNVKPTKSKKINLPNPPTKSSSSLSPFMELPGKIRNMIYRYLVVSRTKIALISREARDKPVIKRLPKTTKNKALLAIAAANPPVIPPKRVDMAIAGTCHEIGDEVAGIFFQENLFEMVIGDTIGLPYGYNYSSTFLETTSRRRLCSLVVERVCKVEIRIPWLCLQYLMETLVRKFVRGRCLQELSIHLEGFNTQDHARVKKLGLEKLQPLKQLRGVKIGSITWDHVFPEDFELEDGWEVELREIAGGNAPFVLD
ncbi:MAG: hypothetical protein M1812_004581 [Candelaria pacifica]|nr:MAG: hypothetical protein M1812_004581 [Candelaria pacifica]